MPNKEPKRKVKIEIERSILQQLLAMKKVGESYSDVIERLLSTQRMIP
jgi:predicted CopG family antitoxin